MADLRSSADSSGSGIQRGSSATSGTIADSRVSITQPASPTPREKRVGLPPRGSPLERPKAAR